MSTVKETGTNNFQTEVLEERVPVVVDFWAAWCGPCRMLTPVIERAAEQLGGRLKVVKCNVDENPELAASYGVRSIPNLIFFNRGQIVAQSVGLVNEKEFLAKAEEVLKAVA